MAQRHHHYERAFERYLRTLRVPYVAVDEAKKALMPDDAPLQVHVPDGAGGGRDASLKSFDFVIYGSSDGGRAPGAGPCNLLAEVKGRRVAPVNSGSNPTDRPGPRRGGARLESWVTLEDVWSLKTWQNLFGPEFQAVFVFVYWCEDQPPDALFQEIFEYRGNWYAVRAVTLDNYIASMKTRSPRWGTVDVPSRLFAQISQPLLPFVAPVHHLRDGFLGESPLKDLGPELPTIER